MWEALLFHTGIMDAMLGCVGVVWEYVESELVVDASVYERLFC